jgi:hypothetical protein
MEGQCIYRTEARMKKSDIEDMKNAHGMVDVQKLAAESSADNHGALTLQ